MNNIFKKLFILSITSILSLGGLFLVTRGNTKEVAATNIGDDSLWPIIFSTNGNSASSCTLTANNKTYQMKKIQQSSSSSLFAVSILRSDLSSKIRFRGGSFNFETESKTTTLTYKMNGTSTGTSVTTTNYGTYNRYRESSVSTRRLWFTFTSSVNGYFSLFSSNNRFMMNRITNNIDSRDYYYVDIPTDRTTFSLQYINVAFETTVEVLASRSYTNAELQRFNIVDVSNKTIDEYVTTDGYDQYLINEYLRGFSSCSDSDINGYNAYPYISSVVSHFTSYESGTLSDVSQDDYLRSDYDDGYISTSIRGGMSVTAQEKLDEIQANYLSHQNRIINNDDTSNRNMWIIIITSLLTISAVSSYFLIKRKKNS